MSEKKSNGQVPEEGPDGKNLEQSEEKESFAFLEETIKPKKISRQQGRPLQYMKNRPLRHMKKYIFRK